METKKGGGGALRTPSNKNKNLSLKNSCRSIFVAWRDLMVTLMIRHSTLPLKISMIWSEEILLCGWRKILSLKDLYVLWCLTKVLSEKTFNWDGKNLSNLEKFFNTH